MTYSIDFRKRVLSFVQEGHTRTEASKLFGINPSTLRRWEQKVKTEGHLQDKPRQRSPRKLPKDQLLAYVEQHPDAYLREIAEHFSCAINAVWKALRKYNITLKKDDTLSRTRPRKN
ncbi:transposase [Streptococcus azizii]|uniref:Transposase n=1 Tax=Streptococcus azizii TaxID=1579424 RepID=A0AB36JRN3_9STRE|nr:MULTISPECIES: IS630 transposase-related protein [Streptococcus]MBF0776751.1 helix-turn-helix domain-containing protein [Streptococcus sp. 19428wD3_AN2]ONK27553.1 transposase [Streptococcus azizii]ONK27674.1 transposase [Streptococcus azizii]ONK29854.1 transposase [Streptococcus azizii]TFU82488.1 transposase [Streptococcus sp. AN2]